MISTVELFRVGSDSVKFSKAILGEELTISSILIQITSSIHPSKIIEILRELSEALFTFETSH